MKPNENSKQESDKVQREENMIPPPAQEITREMRQLVADTLRPIDIPEDDLNEERDNNIKSN